VRRSRAGRSLGVYQRTVGGYYDTISIGAYNFWAIFHRTAQQSDTALAFGLVPFRSVGLLLAALAMILVLWQLRGSLLSPRTSNEHLLGTLLSGALMASALFIFATEMHERYQFAYIVLALPMAFCSTRGAVLYAITSLLILLNLTGAMAFGIVDMTLFRVFPALPRVIAVLQVIVLFLTIGSAARLVRFPNVAN
jgi:hypothetical protein